LGEIPFQNSAENSVHAPEKADKLAVKTLTIIPVSFSMP